jgi:hypothetical protein
MRRFVGVLMLCSLLLSFGATAQAASGTWVSGNTGNWNNPVNWSTNPSLPGTADTATINNGTVTLNDAETHGIVLMGNGLGTDVASLSISTGANLTVSKSSTELFGLVRVANATTTVNHSGGTVTIFQPAGTAGEMRLSNIANGAQGTASANYNLSGTGVLDVQVLNRGDRTRTYANFNATGGTLAIRTSIIKWGLISDGYTGFNQGTCKLEVGAIGTVGAISFGNGSNTMDYAVGSGGTLNIDIASASSYDKITQYGNVASTAGATLQIDLLGGFVPTNGSTFDIWTFSDKSKAGSGAVTGLSANWAAAWVDTNADSSLDTLRLTYTPEPATIALLGLGLLAIRRNKK